MGLLVHIFESPVIGNCSNNGVSARVKRLTLTNVEGPFEPCAEAPAAKLVKRPRVGNVVVIPDAVADKWTMFGGALVYSSDSRFGEKVRELSGYEHGFAVNLHDRVEG